MRDDRPDFQFDGNAGGAGTFGEAGGIIAQDFVRTYVNEQRRKTGEIGVERRRERIARIGVAEIVARGGRDVRAAEHGATIAIGSNGVTSGGEIGPRRIERSGGRERNSGGAKSEHERETETAAGGLARDNDALRRVARAEKRPVEGDGIIDGGGKPIFGGEAIVRSKDAEPLECKESGDGTMRLRRARKVSATVKIEKYGTARRRALEAFAWDTAEVRGRDLYC
jgi:hypothetical protein